MSECVCACVCVRVCVCVVNNECMVPTPCQKIHLATFFILLKKSKKHEGIALHAIKLQLLHNSTILSCS